MQISLRSLISIFVVRCLDSIIPTFAISKSLRLQLASISKHASLSLTWSSNPKDRFYRDVAHFQPGAGKCSV